MSRLLTRNLAKKRVFGYLGGTNSGKTSHAIKQLIAAKDGGVYCGPLRLLAHQVCEDVKAHQHPCSLITGELSVIDERAKIVSCTVEMAGRGLQQTGLDSVTVIDEIQLIGDDHRGWAWTSAMMNCSSSTLILCGSLAAQPLLESLIPHIEITTFERLSKLRVDDAPLSNHELQDGDAVVTFSRKQLFSLKQSIERDTGKKVAVVYGALPPEERVHQAELFNSRRSPLLVCTDAIGLGLNLDIDRIVFEQTSKFAPSGGETDWEKSRRDLTAAEVQQIGGRAGRGTKSGVVSAFKSSNLAFLRRHLKADLIPIERAGVAASYEDLHFLSAKHDCSQLATLYEMYEDEQQLDERFQLCSMSDEKAIAQVIDEMFPEESMDLEMKHMYSMAPLDANNSLEVEYLNHYSTQHVKHGQVFLDLTLRKFQKNLDDDQALRRIRVLESIYSISGIYLWLAQRFSPEVYVDLEKASVLKLETIKQLNHILGDLGHLNTPRLRRQRGQRQDKEHHINFLKKHSAKARQKRERKRARARMSDKY